MLEADPRIVPAGRVRISVLSESGGSSDGRRTHVTETAEKTGAVHPLNTLTATNESNRDEASQGPHQTSERRQELHH